MHYLLATPLREKSNDDWCESVMWLKLCVTDWWIVLSLGIISNSSSSSNGITGAVFQDQKWNGHYNCLHKSTFVGTVSVFDGLVCKKLNITWISHNKPSTDCWKKKKEKICIYIYIYIYILLLSHWSNQ